MTNDEICLEYFANEFSMSCPFFRLCNFLILQVLVWKNRVDRSSIDRIKSSQNPTIVVGLAMEMIMVLIGKKSPADRIEKREYPLREEYSGIFSASSSSTKTGQSKKRELTH